jgi:N6-adenosine-specific RNA methylase IME4
MKNWQFGLLTPHRYGVIYADFPWRYANYGPDGLPQRATEQHYPTMGFDDLAALRIADLAAKDCALMAWSTSAHTDQLFKLASIMGFEFKGKAFAWSKLNPFHGKPDPDSRKARKITDDCHWHIGMGRSTRKNTEDCWLFTRGAPKRLNADVRELCIAPVNKQRHSEKPEEIRERIERLFPGPRCELFSRKSRPGWDMWGNDTGKFG